MNPSDEIDDLLSGDLICPGCKEFSLKDSSLIGPQDIVLYIEVVEVEKISIHEWFEKRRVFNVGFVQYRRNGVSVNE